MYSMTSGQQQQQLLQSTAKFPNKYTENDFWEPQLKKMRGFGMVHSEKFQWPSQNLLKQLDLNKVIKLCSIELGMTSNLFEIRLCFTGGLRSPLLRAEGAGIHVQGGPGHTEDQQQIIEIDPTRLISEVFINQNKKSGMIYGIRIVDDKGSVMVDEHWNKFSAISNFLQDETVWRNFKIPSGHEIIGCYGSTDGQYIRSLGWVIWKPNPVTAGTDPAEIMRLAFNQ